MPPALLTILTSIGGQVAKNLFPDPADELKRLEVQNQVQLAVLQQAGAIKQAAADIVKAEAQSGNWLASSWRPILMLTFGALIVARWFGWTAPGIQPDEYVALWNIVNVGIGGYVIGRSVEKAAPAIAAALKR